jgi:hypothetical protein
MVMTVSPKCFTVFSSDGGSPSGQALINTVLCTRVCVMLLLAAGLFSVYVETLLLQFMVSVLYTQAYLSDIKGNLLRTLS